MGLGLRGLQEAGADPSGKLVFSPHWCAILRAKPGCLPGANTRADLGSDGVLHVTQHTDPGANLSSDPGTNRYPW